MKDERKTKAQLIEELSQLRARVAELEGDDAEHRCAADDHLFREMVEHANDIIYTLSPDGVLTYVSPNWTEILGHETDEVIGTNFVPFVHPDDLDACFVFLKSVFETGERKGPIEYRVKHKDGAYRYHTSNAALIDAPDGSKVYVGIAHDITGRKQAEQGLLTARDELQQRVDDGTREIKDEKAFTDMALNALPGLFYVFDREGRMKKWNRRFEQLTGYSEAEVAERVVTAYFDGEGLERVGGAIEETFEWGESAVEAEIIRKDGDRLPIFFSGMRAEIGGEQYVVGMGIDISERKRTEHALEASEQLFRNLTESIGAMIFIVSIEEDRVLYANPAAVKGTGYSLEELTGDDPPEVIAPESQEVIDEARAAFMRGEELPESMELKFITKSGEERWYESTGSVFMTDDGLVKVTASFDMTERKRAEAALRESERKFRALADGTPAGIAITQDDRFIYANKAVMERSGVTWEEFSKISPHDSLSEAAHEAGHKALMEAMEKGDQQWRFEVHEDDGIWFEVTASMIKLDGQDAVIWTSFDITDRRKTQDALEESERRFRSLAETTSAHISIMQDDKYVYANQAFLDYNGIERDELELFSMEDMMMGVMGPGIEEQAMPAYEEAQRTGAKSFSFEWQDLQDHWYQAHATEMELDGKPAYMLMNVDITEVKQAQERIKQSERQYRTIFDTAGTGMISFGDDSVITLANEEWTKLTGYTIDETVGKLTWMPFFTEASLEKMKEFHRMRSEDPTSAPRAYEAQLVDRSGSVHDGIVNIQVVPGTHQRVASFHDMTDLKRAQQQMYRADKMAALGQIIAGVAHEINNPNNFIYFNLPILRRYVEAMRPLLERSLTDEPDLTILNMPYDDFLEDMYKLLENMEHGSKRITSIVSDLKTYIRSGEDLEMKEGPLRPIIDQVMTLIGKQVRKMVRRFDTEVADPLPMVKVNPGKLEQVIINLVINAGQAADKEDSWIRLYAGPSGDGKFVEIQVEDNGAGIPRESQDQVFEPFYTSKGREEGTGLGLSISHQIVQDHGGELTVKSEVGQGTCFTVRLPAAPGE